MKKEITLYVDEQAIKGLNNAVAAYGDIVWSCFLGLEIPAKFTKLKQLSEEELKSRFDAVKDFYLEIEKQFNET